MSYKASAEQFPMFVWIALILLAIDAVILPTKIGWLKRYTFFSRQKIAAKGGESLKNKTTVNKESAK